MHPIEQHEERRVVSKEQHVTRHQGFQKSNTCGRAIDLDPNYAAAYAALGCSHFETLVSRWTEFRQEELEQAVAVTQKALALDPTTTSAYRLLAFINMYKRRYDLALRQIGHALEINPSDVDGTIRAETFWCERAEQGRQCRGSLRFDRGRLLTANSLCWAHYFLCRYNEAVETADRAFSRGPGSSVEMITHSFLAAAYGEMGRSGCRGRTRSSCFCPSF